MASSTALLIIDPQNDFCDLPPHRLSSETGIVQNILPSLPVAGANADLTRLAAWLTQHADHIEALSVTLDSHQYLDIAHPGFWQDSKGEAPPPFTTISSQQLEDGLFRSRDPAVNNIALDYLQQLESLGRYTHTIWPVHCEIGSWGHGIHSTLLQALRTWQIRQTAAIKFIMKGQNPWTEHYSALRAEVPLPEDDSTQLNDKLIRSLAEHEQIVIAGEASTHCVRASVLDLLTYLPAQCQSRLVLLSDCMSPIPGFEALQEDMFQKVLEAGGRILSSSEFSLS